MSFSSRQLGLFTATCLSIVAICSLPVASQTSSQTSLSPRFSPDPQVYNGTTSISTPAKGSCHNFNTAKPNYKFRLKEAFGFLSLKVFSGEKIALLVGGPDGVSCRHEFNPEISGAWPAGEYQVWVGSQSSDRTQYRLSISETRQ
jgi:hypothetical protein